jgi:hypothetical protein
MGSTTTLKRPDNPYVGPRTFLPEERAKFFGRDREAYELTSLIIANRLVLFYSPSGAGKSSLLNTMIGPMLAEAGFEILPTGRVSGYSGRDKLADNIFTYNLISSLHGADEIPSDFETLTLADFLDYLAHHEDGAYYYDPGYVYPPDAVFKPRVLFIDQFEELITTNTAAWPQRPDFFRQLAKAMTLDEQLWIILIMREDYVANFDPYLHLIPGQLRYRYYMERLKRNEAAKAITLPVEELRRFEPEAAERLLDNLLRLRGANGQEGEQLAQFVEPVQLQAVCYQMWEELSQQPGETITAEDVRRFADVDRALTNFYEDIVKQTAVAADTPEGVLRDWFETELITEAGTRNMVYRGEERTGGLPTPVAEAVLRRFIIREEVRPGGVWYELVHDRLVQPILAANRAWQLDQPLLRLATRWDNENRNIRLLLEEREYNRLTEDGSWKMLGPLVERFVIRSKNAIQDREKRAQIEKSKEDKRRADEAEKRKQFAYRLTSIAVFFLVVAIVAGLSAIWNANEARNNLATATAALVAADVARATEQAQAIIAAENEARAVGEATRANQEAERAGQQTSLAESRRLAYPAGEFLRRGNATAALLTGREVYNLTEGSSNVTMQEQYGLLWTALNAAADQLPTGQQFRQPVTAPTGLDLTAPLIAGPEPNTVAFLSGQEMVWWELDALPSVVHTYTLPYTATHALSNDDKSILLIAGKSAVYWRLNNGSFDVVMEWDEPENVTVNGLVISQDGRHWAVAYCKPIPSTSTSSEEQALDRDSSSSRFPSSGESDASVEADVPLEDSGDNDRTDNADNRGNDNNNGTDVADQDEECFIRVDNFEKETIFEEKSGRFIAAMFIGLNGDDFIWADSRAMYKRSLTPDQPAQQLLTTEDNHLYTAVAFMRQGNEDWLAVASCMAGEDDADEGACSPSGYMRWRNLTSGEWLGPATKFPAFVNSLFYLPERQSLIAYHNDRQIQEWRQTNIARWPDLACQITGRNLTLGEWRTIAPRTNVENWEKEFLFNFTDNEFYPQLACPEFGLDLSFATAALLDCSDKSILRPAAEFSSYNRLSASRLYGHSERPMIDGRHVSFVDWALPLLFNEASANPDKLTNSACYARAVGLNPALELDLLLHLDSRIAQLQGEPGGPALDDIDALTVEIDTANLPDWVAARYRLYLAALYGEACAYRLSPKSDSPACEQYERLTRQIQADDTLIQPIPFMDERRPGWQLFVGGQGDLVAIALNAPETGGDPYLTLRDVSGRAWAYNDDIERGNLNALIRAFLPEDGVYYIEPGWHYGNPGSAAPLLTLAETPVLTIDQPVLASRKRTVWQFYGQQGDILAFALPDNDPAVNIELQLTVYNEDGLIVWRDWLYTNHPPVGRPFRLPEDGRYFLVLTPHYQSVNEYTLLLSLVRFAPLAFNQPVTGQQTAARFTGRQNDIIYIDVQTTDPGGYVSLTIYDSDWRILFDRQDWSDDLTQTSFLLPDTGDYFVYAVWYGDSEEEYALTLTVVEPQLLPVGAAAAVRQESWWRFTGQQGDIVTFTLADNPPDDFIELQATMYDKNGLVIWAGWLSTFQQPISPPFLLPEDGDYFLMLTPYDRSGDEFMFALSIIGSRELSLSVAAAGAGDQSWWRFAAEPGVFSISITPDGPDQNGVMRLYNAGSRQRLFEIALPASSLTQTLFLPADSIYLLELYWDDGLPNEYTALISPLEPRLLPLEITAAEAAQSMWQFRGEQGAVITVTLAAETPDSFPQLFLYHADGREPAYTFDDQKQDASLMATLPTSGVYFVQVRWESGNPSDYVIQRETVLSVEAAPDDLEEAVSRDHALGLIDRLRNNEDMVPLEYDKICRYGALWGLATTHSEVMLACQQAVALDPDNPYYAESRAIARAMIGDFDGAAADLRFYIRRQGVDAERQEWLRMLRNGENPFASESLRERLRQESQPQG